MAERKSITITWRIKNFSFCWQQKAEELPGPEFYIEGMEGTNLTLVLFPQATTSKETGDIHCYFYLEREEKGQTELEIDYEISALGYDGLPIVTASFNTMKTKNWSSPLVLRKDMVFLKKLSIFLPKDSLTIRCRIWKNNQENINSERYFATTRIELQKASLFGIVKKFREEECRQLNETVSERYDVEIISESTEYPSIFINFKITEGTPYAEIYPENKLMKYCKCELYLTDNSEKRIFYGEDEFLFDFDMSLTEERKQYWNFPLKATREYGFSQTYLKMENLFLRCEVTYSTGILSDKFEKVDNSTSTFRNGSCLKEKIQKHVPSFTDDMFSLMTNSDCWDIYLKTEDKTFPAHSIILSARSLFFRQRLGEKNKVETISIADLDNETLNQMLVFLYTDTIQNLDSMNAIKLYTASERYGIPAFKNRCSCFLQDNIDSSICCDVLQAADQLRDFDLKKAALNYILEHYDEVIGSDKWQNLERFTELTEEVLHLKKMNS